MSLPDDGPVVMVNMLKFKPEGGAQEYAKYSIGVEPLLRSVGAKIVFAGQAVACLIGNGEWDSIALVEYPNPAALISMVESEEYKAIHHHREAGLEGQVNYAILQNRSAK